MLKAPLVIVEDDTDDQALIKEAAEKAYPGISVRIFNSGLEVYDYLSKENQSPFLILCDIRMPKMDGIALREKIDKHPGIKQKAIPFVYLTGSATTTDVIKAYELSVQGFFTKPNLVEEWEKLLQLILSYWVECIHPNSLSKNGQIKTKVRPGYKCIPEILMVLRHGFLSLITISFPKEVNKQLLL